ncbi:MAG: hypothetical protein NXI13_05620 [Proteobacteria bacterium]|nr:hypothetical protein [Pseudomonadota bacterium]
MSGDLNLDEIFAEMDAAAARAEATLNGQFATIYEELRNLAPADIDDITPDISDQKEYERMMALVQAASQQNLDQAELINRIRELGDVAKKIAQKIPSLAALI